VDGDVPSKQVVSIQAYNRIHQAQRSPDLKCGYQFVARTRDVIQSVEQGEDNIGLADQPIISPV